MGPLKEEVLAQVERILQNDSFQRVESHRRLLSYLTDRFFSGDAEQLKEYTIGMDVFGKGKEYNPREDSGVRIQVGRLRQKLSEYYATAGVNDEIVVTLPKGQFKLLFERRLPDSPTHRDGLAGTVPGDDTLAKSGEVRWRRAAFVLAGALAAAIVWGSIELRRANQAPAADPRWTAAMETFWRPFVQDNRPLVVAVGAPLFVGLQGCCFYRDLNKNRWEEVIQDANFKDVRKALKDRNFFAVRPYTTVGQAKSVLLVGALLGQRIPKILFARSTDLSWQQLSDSNALFIGGPQTFNQMLGALPVKSELVLEAGGLRVLHPGKGEPEYFSDSSTNGGDGEIHALISVLPGPSGRGFVGDFAANLGAGSVASVGSTPADSPGFAATLGAGSLSAIEFASDPASVEDLVGRMKDKDGRFPTYFQVALSVRFKGGVPTSSRYLLSREVRLENVPGKR